MRARFCQVLGPSAAEQNAAVNLGVQRLHPAAKHLRPTGQFGDVANLEPRLAQQFGRAPGGNQLHSSPRQHLRKLNNSSLVVNAYDRALNRHSGLRRNAQKQCTKLCAKCRATQCAKRIILPRGTSLRDELILAG